MIRSELHICSLSAFYKENLSLKMILKHQKNDANCIFYNGPLNFTILNKSLTNDHLPIFLLAQHFTGDYYVRQGVECQVWCWKQLAGLALTHMWSLPTSWTHWLLFPSRFTTVTIASLLNLAKYYLHYSPSTLVFLATMLWNKCLLLKKLCIASYVQNW